MENKKYYILMEADEAFVIFDFNSEKDRQTFFEKAKKKLYNEMTFYDSRPKVKSNSELKTIITNFLNESDE